jgi:hypothetical protein
MGTGYLTAENTREINKTSKTDAKEENTAALIKALELLRML